MNVNSIMLGLEEVTNLTVEEDYSEEHSDEWITFTYADEGYDDYGDNKPISEYCNMQIKVTLLKTTDYFELKENIKNYLLENEAYNIRSQVYMDPTDDIKKYRILLVTCDFKKEKENENGL